MKKSAIILVGIAALGFLVNYLACVGALPAWMLDPTSAELASWQIPLVAGMMLTARFGTLAAIPAIYFLTR